MNLEDLNKIVEEVVREMAESGRPNNGQDGFDTRLAAAMEHSMIRPDATPDMVRQFCGEAVKYGFANVALAPCFVSMAADLLKGTRVKVATAVAFPMGIAKTSIKVAEALEAIADGAEEIDLPINTGLLKSGDYQAVKNDIEAVVAAAKKLALIKVVVDLGALNQEERIKAALIAKMAGADYLKVAAGSKPGGVAVEDIELMRRVVGAEMGIKADGGIKDQKTALAVINAGANRIGASGSVKIVTGS